MAPVLGSVTEEPAAEPYELRTIPTVRQALSERLPEAVAIVAYEFMTGPLIREPYRVGKQLLPRWSSHGDASGPPKDSYSNPGPG